MHEGLVLHRQWQCGFQNGFLVQRVTSQHFALKGVCCTQDYIGRYVAGTCISSKPGMTAGDTYGRDFRRLSTRVTLFEIGPDRCDDVSLAGDLDPVLDVSRGCKGTFGLLLGWRVLRVRRSAGHMHSSRPLLLRHRPHGRSPSQRFFLRRPKSQCRQHESYGFL